MKHPKKKFKKFKGVMNRKILNLRDSSSSESSGEGVMWPQLNRKGERKGSNVDGSSTKQVN
jgi:hypothetical protein